MTDSKDIIHVENVNKNYEYGKSADTYALEMVNFSVKEGEVFCILGPSGCGKSTLLNIMAGFEEPTSGKVIIHGREVDKPNPKYVTMFQEYGLFPWRSVLKNVTFGLEMKGIDKKKQEDIARKYIKMVHLDGFENIHPSQLSGGMQRRVALARTLAVEPEIIFMDEPFTGLDAFTKAKMEDELADIIEKNKTTIVLITHDVHTAVALGDRIMLLSHRPGKIKDIITLAQKRPRRKTDPQLLDVESKILSEFQL